jgi:hypothetical protein
MNAELEFHDSDVRAMRFSGADLVVDFQRAIVYPAAEEMSISPGTYQQPVVLTFLAATIVGNLAASGWLSDGVVTVSGTTFQLLPVPASIDGVVAAELVFTSGEQVKISAAGLRCIPSGPATWLQPLPQ